MSARILNRTGFYVLLCAVLAITMFGWWQGSGMDALQVPGARLIAIGRLCGLLATICILLEVFLMARVPFMESGFDLDEYLDLHRLIGYGILLGITGHITFLVMGYAQPSHVGPWQQFIVFNASYEDVLKASLGTVVFFGGTIASIGIIRKRLRYEVWHAIHLLLYGAILLTFMHQINAGGDFSTQQWFVAFWFMVYIGTFGLLGYYRFMRPLIHWYQYRFVVDRIVPEAEGIFSIYVTGRDIEHYDYKPGQYGGWRFISSELLLESHPYSFSSPPGQSYIRCTFKVGKGDFGKKLVHVQPGTPVVIDGPRGAFTADRATQRNVTLIGGGIGVAPFLATARALIRAGKQVRLRYAFHGVDELAFQQELISLKQQGLDIILHCSEENRRLTEADLQLEVLENRSVFICGPDAMTRHLSRSLVRSGLAKDHIVAERFCI